MAKKILVIVSLLTVAVMISSGAKADTITFDLTQSNASSDNPWTTPPTGGFGTVTLTTVSGGIQVSVQLVANYTLIQDVLAFNWGGSGTAPKIGVTGLPTGYSLGATGQRMDGFGVFNYQITGPNVGQATSTGSLTFTIMGTWASVNDFVKANPGGFVFAAHIYDPNSTATNKTGYVAATVPEPGSMTLLLLGAGTLLLGACWKDNRHKN